MGYFTSLFLLASVLSTALASPALQSASFSSAAEIAGLAAAEPIPPTEDPWYSAPKGFEHTVPGSILRLRHAPGNMTTIAGPNCSAAYNILYRTTDSKNRASWAVTTLFTPTHAFSSGGGGVRGHGQPSHSSDGTALLGFSIPYDSYYLNAAPSYSLYDPGQLGYLTAVIDSLARGWFVSVADYEGPRSSFTAGVQSGHATLDALRAVQLLAQRNPWLGLAPAATTTAKTALWGYSGGAIANEWAAELQTQYAPDLAVHGMAIGGMTPSVESVLRYVTGTDFAGLIPSALLGITSQDAAAQKALMGDLKPTGVFNQTTFLAASTMSWLQTIRTFSGQDVFAYFASGEGIFSIPRIASVFATDGLMGKHGVPKMPVFAYKAISDEVSVVEESDALIRQLCGEGVAILYERNAAGEHVSEYTNGHLRSLDWLSTVFAGTLEQKACVVKDVNVTDPTGPKIPGSE